MGNKFVGDTTDCQIDKFDIAKVKDGVEYTDSVYEVRSDCVRFIMASTFDDVLAKSKKIARLLRPKTAIEPQVTPKADYRYLWFLLLPCNLLIYLGWSKLVAVV